MLITIDYENNAEKFWANLRTQRPSIADRFEANDTAELTDEEWTAVQAIEGFAEGPEHAREALLVTEE